MPLSRSEIEARINELEEDQSAAGAWGAAVGVRHEELVHLRRQLAALDDEPLALWDRQFPGVRNALLSTIPQHMHQALVEYIVLGAPVGGFLTSVLRNDLREAAARADDTNKHLLYEYVQFLYMWAPATAWGSPDAFATWRAQGGLKGRPHD